MAKIEIFFEKHNSKFSQEVTDKRAWEIIEELCKKE